MPWLGDFIETKILLTIGSHSVRYTEAIHREVSELWRQMKALTQALAFTGVQDGEHMCQAQDKQFKARTYGKTLTEPRVRAFTESLWPLAVCELGESCKVSSRENLSKLDSYKLRGIQAHVSHRL